VSPRGWSPSLLFFLFESVRGSRLDEAFIKMLEVF